MLHATTTADATRSQEELHADYPKEAAKDRRDQRRALEVPGLTAGLRDAVQAALAAYDAAEALYATSRQLDDMHMANRSDRALARRSDQAEARWHKARAAALTAAERVLDVPTAPGAEATAKFQAFLRLTYVPNTNPRRRKPFTTERAVDSMFDEDAKRLLVKALKAIDADRSVQAVQIIGPTMAQHVHAYKAAVDAEADASGTPEYNDRYNASIAAEDALLAAHPRTLAELNAKAKAFTNPDGLVDDTGDSAQACRVIEALARDIDRLSAAVCPPTDLLDRTTLDEVADFLSEVDITRTEEWCQRAATLLRRLAAAPATPMPRQVDRSAWDAAMAEFESAYAAHKAVNLEWNEAEAALYREAFGDELERFTYPFQSAYEGVFETRLRWMVAAEAEKDPTLDAAAKPAVVEKLKAFERDFGDRDALLDRQFASRQEAASDRWFDALGALDALPAPDLAALAFKMREQLALELSSHPWELMTADGIERVLTVECDGVPDRLRVSWYQDVLRFMGVTGPIVDAKAWDVEAFVQAFRDAGGRITLSPDPHVPVYEHRAHFWLDPNAPNLEAAAVMANLVSRSAWRNRAVVRYLLEQQQEGGAKRAAPGLVPVIGYVGGNDEVHLYEGAGAYLGRGWPVDAPAASANSLPAA